MVDDLHVAELASLLEIETDRALAALTEAGGDIGAAIEIVRSQGGAVKSNEDAECRAPEAPCEHNVTWEGGGFSMLTPTFEHVVSGEPPLREMHGARELLALSRGIASRDFLPVLCAAARAGRGFSADGGALGQHLLDSSWAEVESLGDISLHSIHPDSTLPEEAHLSREEAITAGRARLAGRLGRCGLSAVITADDGNCLFEACAEQILRGSGRRNHALVRHRAVAEMCRSSATYAAFFPSEEAFRSYLAGMAVLGTWGDELVLRAVADTYDLTAHVLTSSDDNWYLVYSPADRGKTTGRHLFLTYLSPIHYSGFEAKPLETSDVEVRLRS